MNILKKAGIFMKINFRIRKIFAKPDETNNISNIETSVPDIDLNRVKKLTMNKIQQEENKIFLTIRSISTKAACAVITAVLITTGSVYAFSNEGVQSFISQLTGVQQTKILMVGEAITNRDYKLKVHEIVTDSYVGDVVISVEALSDKSKKDFDNYHIDLKHIGSGQGLGELAEYRETYIKYYKISFSGATHKYSRNDGKLQFSIRGMKQAIEVPLSPTIECIDMEITEDNSNGYEYRFDKLHLSEIGLTLEGTDTRNLECEYWYNIELLFADGTKELLEKKMNENGIKARIPDTVENSPGEAKIYDDGLDSFSQNTATTLGNTITDTSINGDLKGSGSGYHSGDVGNYVNICIGFSKNLPLDTIKQVIINGITYDIER